MVTAAHPLVTLEHRPLVPAGRIVDRGCRSQAARYTAPAAVGWSSRIEAAPAAASSAADWNSCIGVGVVYLRSRKNP